MNRILAKPFGRNPITLEDHTQHVIDEAKTLLDTFPYWSVKYKRITGTDLGGQLINAAKYHDKGKAHDTWQRACQKDRQFYLETGKEQSKNLRNSGIRHEFASLWWLDKQNIPITLAEKAAIAAHHRKLSFKHQHRWENDDNGAFIDFWEEFCREVYNTDLLRQQLPKEALLKRYQVAGVRSLLQLADHRASKREAGIELAPLNYSFDYEFKYASKRPVQQAVLEHSDKQEIILRAPTGSGKTDAALLWAKEQIENGFADRLVIAMPTRFTSTSLDLDISKDISATGLYHSSAWYARYKKAGNNEGVKDIIEAARLLLMPATVTTIDHLLMALTGTREDHHSIFFSLMHSCVVIDEADFYDEFIQANITKLLEVLRVFDIRVMIMSATVPESAKDLYGIQNVIDPYTSKQAKKNSKAREEANRKRCRIKIEGNIENLEDIEGVLLSILEEPIPRAIIYANTVNRALKYLDWFKGKGISPILYHSRFTEYDKKRIEGDLIDALGKKAWESNDASGVAILTQIGEMSLNISAPFMISDLCPMDRLTQRVGRLSRFEGMATGDVHIITPTKDGAVYSAPYGSFDRDEKNWVPAEAFVKTEEILEEKAYSAQDFVDAVNYLYPEQKPFSDKASLNKMALNEHLSMNWLILPKAESKDDDFETSEWLSRDIPPQRIVLTQKPYDFNTYGEYRDFELEHGISCPIWQIEKGKQLSRAQEIKFSVDDEEITLPYTSIYSPTEGLILNLKREKPQEDSFV
ncbi:CRISPR-associated helicase Cas3' [Gracilimonas mengyeensis]|uniref:CRISPR-associated endonuclease/helicase Cas3 n=1 Tax=Gracilimonas mengyeensis TaxID=1302730 RepID=A0A521CC06_9BACT|nr:CRISPR-associated helicase Cas3' [Gracilimonas mengyeensis]SMO56938.1 CRISPR-associated endonuclease/helicase Cas3 [Gracilimonas mengyeensis]